MNLPAETKPCDNCGKTMIAAWTGGTDEAHPPEPIWMYWCLCGTRERGLAPAGEIVPVDWGEAEARWREVNEGAGAVSASTQDPGAPSCGSCCHYKAHGGGDIISGDCRRRAPVQAMGYRLGAFPLVLNTMRCGEFEQDVQLRK